MTGWIAFEQIEPSPDPYWCAALIASTIAQVHGSKLKLSDFLPKPLAARPNRGPSATTEAVRQDQAKVMAFFAALATRDAQP